MTDQTAHYQASQSTQSHNFISKQAKMLCKWDISNLFFVFLVSWLVWQHQLG